MPLRESGDLIAQIFDNGVEADALYEDGILIFARTALPQIQSFTITPTSSTSASQLITGNFTLAAAATTYVDAINASGNVTRALVSRNRRTGSFTFTVTGGEDYRFVLTATNVEGTVHQTVIYMFHVNGAIVTLGPITYGAQTPVPGGGVNIGITIPIAFRGKELESATFSRSGLSVDLRTSHRTTRSGNDYTHNFQDTLTIGVGVVTYTLAIIVNGTPLSRTISTRPL